MCCRHVSVVCVGTGVRCRVGRGSVTTTRLTATSLGYGGIRVGALLLRIMIACAMCSVSTLPDHERQSGPAYEAGEVVGLRGRVSCT